MTCRIAEVFIAWIIASGALFPAYAQSTYPSRPVRLVVPYPPGGGADFAGREIARKLTEAWGQQVVVDNRGGAAAAIGHALGAKAAPDGYTLLMGTSGGLVTTPAMGVKLPYDPVKDFVPIGLAVYAPWVLTINPGLPAHTVKEFVDVARARTNANAKKLNFASPGTGTPNHLGGVMLMAMTGIQLLHVPYKGGAVALTDLIAGQVDAYYSSFGSIGPHLKTGRVRAIAVGHPTRLKAWAQVPAVAETYPGYDNSGWYGVLAPVGISQALVKKINADLNRGFAEPDIAKRMDVLGMEVATTTPVGLADLIRTQQERWRKVIKESGITDEQLQ